VLTMKLEGMKMVAITKRVPDEIIITVAKEWAD